MAAAESTPVPLEKLHAREAVERPRAAIAGFVSALLGLAATLIASSSGKLPSVDLADVLRASVRADIGRDGLTSELLRYVDDKALAFMATATLQGVAALLYAYMLVVLCRAVVARGQRVPRMALPMAATGGVLGAISSVGLQVATQLHTRDLIAAEDWLTRPADSSVALVFQLVMLFSVMGLALATILIGLAAMRTGLLTQFLGWVGVGVGATMVLSVLQTGGMGLNTLQMAWALLVGVALSGRTPSGLPPAWEAGAAVPWPTRQQLREQAESGRGSANAQSGPAPTAAAPSPATSKKKRKKRR